MKALGMSVALTTTKGGALHLRVTGTGVQLSTEVRNLLVLPATVAQDAAPTR